MTPYQLCFFNDDRLVYRGEHECADDEEATALARHLASHFEVEVWKGDQLVTRLEKKQSAQAPERTQQNYEQP